MNKCSWIWKLNFVKIAIIPKLICRLNKIPIKFPAVFFAEINKLIPKYENVRDSEKPKQFWNTNKSEGHTSGCKAVSHCAFNLHSLITNDVEYLFVYLLATGTNYLGKCLLSSFASFAHFQLGCLRSYWIVRVLFYIMGNRHLTDIWFANMFSHSVGRILWIVSSFSWWFPLKQKNLILMRLNFTELFFFACVFGVVSKHLCLLYLFHCTNTFSKVILWNNIGIPNFNFSFKNLLSESVPAEMKLDNYSLYLLLITTKNSEQDIKSNNMRTLKSKQKQKDCNEATKLGEVNHMEVVSFLSFFFFYLMV